MKQNALTLGVFLFSILCLTKFSYAYSLSDLDIVVKESVIQELLHHPTLNLSLDYDHITSLSFVYNHNPSRCLSMISGVIVEPQNDTLKPVTFFVVCLMKSKTDLLTGEIVEVIPF